MFYVLLPQWSMLTASHKYPLCDICNVVPFGYNELWWPSTVLVAKSEYKRTIQEATFSATAEAAAAAHKTGLTCISYSGYSNVAPSGHNKLWRPPVVNSPSVTSQILFILPQRFFGKNHKLFKRTAQSLRCYGPSQIVQDNSTVLF